MYDAIVVGTGISGGWAALELCTNGLKTLVLERGRDMPHGDYPTANIENWDLPNQGNLTKKEKIEHAVQAQNSFMDAATKHLWINEEDGEYLQAKPYQWFRGDHLGGRSLVWGRQSYRLSDIDFESNIRNGIAIDWPIRYADIKPWYDYVEKFIGVSGSAEGLAQLPDGIFLPPMKMNKLEREASQKLKNSDPKRVMTIGRVANNTIDHNGRPACIKRNKCIRGCPLGAYFSTQSSTLPAAHATGKMDLKVNAVVKRIIYDDHKQRAIGVEYYDKEKRENITVESRIIFVNASTIATTAILLNSKSKRFPNGLGNDSGQLGKNLMDHHSQVGAQGTTPLYKDYIDDESRPNGIYIPRFKNLPGQPKSDYIGGFGYQGSASRIGWRRPIREAEFGKAYKDAATEFGDWQFGLVGFGECLPYESNQIRLYSEKEDRYGMPLVEINAQWGTNESKMRKDMQNEAIDILERVGLENIQGFDNNPIMGSNHHEMGTARMGNNQKSSVLNKWNQVHAVKNVFVTDGSCMTSSASQNPSLTYMAITARAANYAVAELKRKNL